jgi:large subunit ribosomal protein L21
MLSYAIVQACGKQYWVEPGRFYDFDKLPFKAGDTFTLNNILLMNIGGEVSLGKPFLEDSFSIDVKVVRHLSGTKTRVYKMRSKKKTRKTYGSRPKLTRILVLQDTKENGFVNSKQLCQSSSSSLFL